MLSGHKTKQKVLSIPFQRQYVSPPTHLSFSLKSPKYSPLSFMKPHLTGSTLVLFCNSSAVLP